MNTPHPDRIPVDLIIDRYLPNASSEEREQARKDLIRFTEVMLRIATRRALEERAQS